MLTRFNFYKRWRIVFHICQLVSRLAFYRCLTSICFLRITYTVDNAPTYCQRIAVTNQLPSSTEDVWNINCISIPPFIWFSTCFCLIFFWCWFFRDNFQMSFIAGLHIDLFKQSLLFHVMFWSSHKAKHSVKSIVSAELFVASEEIDNGKIQKRAMAIWLSKEVPLIVALNSRDLLTDLFSKLNSIDKSVQAHVNFIRYGLENRYVSQII